MFCRELEVPSPETALNELPNSWIICYLQETAAQDCFLGLSNLLHPCSDGKESACNAGDLGSILGSGRSPGVGSGNPLQYSGLENSMDRGAWRSQSRTWLSTHTRPKMIPRHETDSAARIHSIKNGRAAVALSS